MQYLSDLRKIKLLNYLFNNKKEAIFLLLSFLLLYLFLVNAEFCNIEKSKMTVRGDSLRGVLDDGSDVLVKKGYYHCYPVLRNDLVIYQYGIDNQIIKIVRGIPGDRFGLQPAGNGEYYILVNNLLLQNSYRQPYLVSKNRSAILALYEKDYKGVIPPDSYLIFGNLPEGTTDSTKFGLISRRDLIGKVIP